MTIENLSEIMEAVKKIENENKKTARLPEVTDAVYEIDGFGQIAIETPPSRSSDYAEINALKKYFEYFKDLEVDGKTKELLDTVRKELALRYDRIDKMVNEDLSELERCLKVHAYKSVLILAGSVLEAFLLDWLSERDGKDYMSEPFYTYKLNRKTQKMEIAQTSSLSDYINSIEELKKPDWMLDNTHTIRKRRNLVHARLQLNEETKINSAMCSEVIGYLKNVIKKRQECTTFYRQI